MYNNLLNQGAPFQNGAIITYLAIGSFQAGKLVSLPTIEKGGLQKFLESFQSYYAKASTPLVPFSKKNELKTGSTLFTLVANLSISKCPKHCYM